ncbi:MAG: hypothetical protein ACJ79R_17455 [Anaeromyxobacteraceae bacterium]
MMKSWVKGLAITLAVGLAAPAMAATTDDAKDTATEKKADAKKKVRGMKKHKDAGDRVDDAKDTASSASAKTKKSARKASRNVKHDVNEATK